MKYQLWLFLTNHPVFAAAHVLGALAVKTSQLAWWFLNNIGVKMKDWWNQAYIAATRDVDVQLSVSLTIQLDLIVQSEMLLPKIMFMCALIWVSTFILDNQRKPCRLTQGNSFITLDQTDSVNFLEKKWTKKSEVSSESLKWEMLETSKPSWLLRCNMFFTKSSYLMVSSSIKLTAWTSCFQETWESSYNTLLTMMFIFKSKSNFKRTNY